MMMPEYRYYTNDSEESSEDADDMPGFNSQNDFNVNDMIHTKASSMGVSSAILFLEALMLGCKKMMSSLFCRLAKRRLDLS